MASRTGIAYNEIFLGHDTGPGHPERPARLESLIAHLQSCGLWTNLQHVMIDPAPEEWILKAHSPDHVRFVRDACLSGRGVLDDGDTRVCAVSYDAALLAAGAVIAGVDAVMSGVLKNVFCAVRPPGHHAESGRAMGFCLFNNVAVGARYAAFRHSVKRAAVIDWDVHHGNGTQEIFYADRSVFYVSLHQYPFYPGTGAADERGTGDGREYTLNIPLGTGSGDGEYLGSFRRDVLPALDAYRPELIFISAGFDAHRLDPLAGMKLTEESFAEMTRLTMEAAGTLCDGRIVSVLEGGYHLDSLARSVESHLRVLSS
ncbi:MAG TPA: histone deacetylase [Bacteroidota bacterium]|nr:histone deacetylase [Bacteroidota bacterium]